jgi:glutamyl-tRNA synthetase
LSKRHGALGVDAYRALGFLPSALRNYLVRLGWSQGDREFFSTQEMIEAFDLDAIGRSPARFDFAKLESLNGHYMRASSDAELVAAVEDILPLVGAAHGAPASLTPQLRASLTASMAGLKERAKTLVELIDSAYYLFAARPLQLDAKATAILTEGGRDRVAGLLPRLEALTAWSAAAVEAEVRAHAEETGAKLGQVAQPLRAALTGRGTSPPIFDVMAVLGRGESLARLADQIAAATA